MIQIKNILPVFVLIAFTFTGQHSLKAQSDSALIFVSDTLIESIPQVKINRFSPHKASMYSAILPGLGQAYNKKYWKIPILYAGIGALVYAIDFNTTYYKKYKNAYRDFLIQDPGNRSYLDVLPPNMDPSDVENNGPNASWFEDALRNKKTYYKRYRDLSYVGMALVYVLNIIDASVDAHFKTFDVSDDLSMHIDPYVTPIGSDFNQTGLQIRFVF